MSMRLAMLCLLGMALSTTAYAVTTSRLFVTATRIPVDPSQVAAATTVITRKEIERRQPKSVPDLLRDVAGLDITQSGGPGKFTGVFLRGTASDHVLVLVNGIRVGSVSAGLTAFAQIPVAHIDHIEIVRGPRASQWGSEAIGGVIQIFTRSGADLEPGHPRFAVGAGYGSYNTYKAHASLAGNSGDSNWQASVARLDTEGFNSRDPVPGPFGFDQPDDDGYDNLSLHLRGGHRFGNGFSIDGFLLRATGTTEFDGTFQDETDFVQQVIGTHANWLVSGSTTLRLTIGESRDEQESFAPDGAFASNFESKRQQISLLADMALAPGQIVTTGVDYRDDLLDASSDFTESSRHNTGVFAEYLGTFGIHSLTASLRHDDNEAFGGATTGGLGWSTNFSNGVKLYAAYATAFKTPSFNELYFPGFGNPNLDPETSRSTEIGVEGRPAWGWWSLRAYHTEIDDLIATVFNADTGVAFPENIDQARIDGIEAELKTLIAGFDVGVAASLMDHEDEVTGNKLPRRPDTSLSIVFSRGFDKLRVGGQILAQGDRFDDAANGVKVDGFATLDLTAEYQLRPEWFLRGKIANVFDEDYQTVATFNSAGRNFFVSLLYRNQP